MKWVLLMVLLTPVFILFQAWNQDEYLQTKLTAELKDGMDVATHDAAMKTDETELEIGNLVFDRDAAEEALRASIQRTFELDSLLQPVDGSVWKDPFELVLVDYVESGSFPQPYNSGPPYYYQDTLNGPSVVAIIKVKHPRFFGVSDDFNYVIGSSHEYVP